jgi:pimeloyl-ACP methyl ester carboxylesterase
LVLLSGTEFALEQTTHIVDDIAAFQGNPALGSAYVSNVLAALRSAVPPGAHLIIAGHSLGGMVAQNLVTNHEFVRQYKADRVITFGSPQTTPEAASTQYVRAEAIGDPVPRLGPLQFQWHRSITVAGPAADPIGIHNSYNKLQELAGYDMAGHFLPDPSRSEAIDLPTRQTFRQECFRLAPGSLREFASPYVQGKSHTAR